MADAREVEAREPSASHAPTIAGSATNPPDDAAPAPALPFETLAPGSFLAGRYRLGALLGRGAMGAVYEAIDFDLGVPVALKVVRPELARRPAALRRFRREILLARRVTHANVCRVYDFGRHVDEERAATFCTMELLHGETLERRIRARGRLPPDAALPLARQMAEALAAAHGAGVVHRDFKSANVMLVAAPGGERAVVTDFGLAFSPEDGQERGPIGTPVYMAPEQVRGEPVSGRADVYSLGVVLFEMLTGVLPFRGGSAEERMNMRLVREPPLPSALVPDVDALWEEVILRCLAREPGDRFSGAGEVAAALAGGQAVELGGRSRRGLVRESDAFFGRQRELEELEQRLALGARLVTLLGPAGVGKTRLALHYGWRARGFPGGVWFSDLSAAHEPEELAAVVGATLGVPPGRDDPLVQLGHAIAGRERCLLVLDNFEQLAPHAPATLGRWLERASQACFLVTSRERLRLGSEEVQALEPLGEPAAAELFVDRAQVSRPGFAARGADADAVHRIVQLLDCLPLAIELGAARMRVMSPTQVASRLEDRFRVLTRGKEGRHSTLEVAIDGSWELLTAQERAAFAQLSVFEGGFTAEAAEAVVVTTPEGAWALDLVQALLDKSLLRMAESDGLAGEPRFAMYLSLQEYARARLQGRGAEAVQSAEERHGGHFARLGTDATIEGLDTQAGTRIALARDLANLIAACRRALLRRDADTAAAVFRVAWEVLSMRGPVALAVELGEEVLGLPGLELPVRARILVALGSASWLSGRTEAARAHLDDAIAIHREIVDRRGEGHARDSLGKLLAELGLAEDARASYEQALALLQETGAYRDVANTLVNLGCLLLDQGQMDEAKSHYVQALNLHRETGNRRGEGTALYNLGTVHFVQGRAEEARALFEQALGAQRETGNRRSEAIVLNTLGLLYKTQGELDRADSILELALAANRQVGNRRIEGSVVHNQAVIEHERGRMEAARQKYEQALAIHREVGNRRDEVLVLFTITRIHLQANRLEDARAALVEAERQRRTLVEPRLLVDSLCSRAQLAAKECDLAAGVKALAEAEALAARIGASHESELGQAIAETRAMLEAEARDEDGSAPIAGGSRS